MITQEQADLSHEFHTTNHGSGRPCDSPKGPVRWRRNGKTQRWKRRPEVFSIPVKHGLYSYDRITEEALTSPFIHALEDCPVGVTDDYRNHAIGCLAQYEHPGSCLDAERTTVWR